jgi:prevent-host-death family protein
MRLRQQITECGLAASVRSRTTGPRSLVFPCVDDQRGEVSPLADKSAIMAKLAEGVQMKTVAATEAKNRLGAILDAAQREPIVISRQERDIAVVLSMADYERLRSGNIQAFLDLRNQVAAEAAANGLTEERLNELLADDDA